MRQPATWVLGCALSVTAAGCMPGGPVIGLREAHPNATPRECRPGESSPWTVPARVECRAYGGATRETNSVAVLATLDRRVKTNDGSVTAVELIALDGQPGPQWPAASGAETRTDKWPGIGDEFTHATAAELPCAFVSLLPGDHTVRISVVSSAYRQGTTRRKGTARFSAVAGGFYALQACFGRGKEGGEVFFWVRDERTLACVSEVCPSE